MSDNIATIAENDPEVRRQVDVHVTSSCKTAGLGSSCFERVSSWSGVRNAKAGLISKARQYKKMGLFRAQHWILKKAKLVIVKAVQGEQYKEIELVQSGRSAACNSR